MLVVDVAVEPTWNTRTHRTLFDHRYKRPDPTFITSEYDVHPADQRFLMVTETMPDEIRIVTNWFEELTQRVPVD